MTPQPSSDKTQNPIPHGRIHEKCAVVLDGGMGGDDWLQGGAGNDSLDGEAGANTLWAGDGNDTLVKNSRRDVLHWGDPPIPHSSPSATTDHSTVTNSLPSATTNDVDNVSDDHSVIPNDGGDLSDSPAPGDVLLIGQGIATVGIEDRELADLDTAGSEAASSELDDTTREHGEGPETPADGGELATNSDTSSANLGAGLELDNALSNAFLASLGSQPASET